MRVHLFRPRREDLRPEFRAAEDVSRYHQTHDEDEDD